MNDAEALIVRIDDALIEAGRWLDRSGPLADREAAHHLARAHGLADRLDMIAPTPATASCSRRLARLLGGLVA